jgi:hypothetical protein
VSTKSRQDPRLLDRLTLFGRARLDVTIATDPLGCTQRRYAVNLLDMCDLAVFGMKPW